MALKIPTNCEKQQNRTNEFISMLLNTIRQLIIFLCVTPICGCTLIAPGDALPLFKEEMGQNKETQTLDKTSMIILRVEKNRYDAMLIELDPRVSSTTYFGTDYVFAFSTVNESDVRVRYYPYSTSVGLSIFEIEKRKPAEEVILRLGEHWFTKTGWKVTSALEPKNVLTFVAAVLKNGALPHDFYLRKDKDWNLAINDASGNLVAKCSNSMTIEYNLPKNREVIRDLDERLFNHFERLSPGFDVSLFFQDGNRVARYRYRPESFAFETVYIDEEHDEHL
jgi:hypothetical protein